MVIKKMYEFTVEGRLDFPFDMLRYDQCWPKSESRDVVAMAPSAHSTLFREGRRVTLMGLKAPTIGRWESFGWKVISTAPVPV
jgi:hypothetical protein